MLRDHKAYIVRDVWDGKTRKYIYNEHEVESLKTYLTLTVEIGRNFTFGDLLSFVEKDTAFYNDVFAGTLGFFDLHVFLTDAKPPKKLKIGKYGFRHLEVTWRGEINEAHRSQHTDSDIEPSFYLWADFLGCGPHKDEYTKTVDPDCTWSLSFQRMNELVNYPLKLNTALTISYWRYEKNDKGEDVPKIEQRPMGEQPFTLFKVLESIFHDISFHGAPPQREKESKKLKKTLKETRGWKKNATKDGKDKKTGKKLWYSMEEIEADWERDRKKKEKKDVKAAPALIKQYSALLKLHRDTEVLAVKKLFMENRGNAAFVAEAKKLNQKYEVPNG